MFRYSLLCATVLVCTTHSSPLARILAKALRARLTPAGPALS